MNLRKLVYRKWWKSWFSLSHNSSSLSSRAILFYQTIVVYTTTMWKNLSFVALFCFEIWLVKLCYFLVNLWKLIYWKWRKSWFSLSHNTNSLRSRVLLLHQTIVLVSTTIWKNISFVAPFCFEIWPAKLCYFLVNLWKLVYWKWYKSWFSLSHNLGSPRSTALLLYQTIVIVSTTIWKK